MKFKVFRFPVEIEFTFLIIMALLGSHFLSAQNYAGFLEISLILLLSILVHELGHAFAFRRYKIESRIVLHGLGGLCIPTTGGNLKPLQSMLVSLSGPFAGFGLALVYFLLSNAGVLPESSLPTQYRDYIVYFINVGWGIFNLLPIYPLDGGQSLHSFLQWRKVPNSMKKSLVVSMILLAGILTFAYYDKRTFILILGAWLLFDNIQKWNQVKSGAYSE